MKKKLIAICFVLISFCEAGAQRFDSVINFASDNNPIEKIYFQFDKDFYTAGETIWFKAYLFTNNYPNSTSSNFYVRLTNCKGEMIESKRYPVVNSGVRGDFSIPDSLPSGYYYIQGYTASLLNMDREFVYSKKIYIGDSVCAETGKDSKAVDISLRFFPEGGNLIDGISTVVAFKGVDPDEKPVNVTGVLKTDEGVTITSFSSYHDGIGKLVFRPKAGRKYYAEVQTGSGEMKFWLPDVHVSGVSLKVENEKGGKKFQLSYKNQHSNPPGEMMFIAKLNNEIIYEKEIIFEGYNTIIGHLLTDSLPSGILHFTLFYAGKPIAERLSFVDNAEYRGQCEIILSNSGTNEAKNSLELIFPDTLGRNISISVTSVGDCSIAEDNNIFSSLLLSNYLNGYIHNPAYYFGTRSDSASLALDNLLLTHKWSRNSLKKVSGDQVPEKKYQDNYLITISGIVSDVLHTKPVEKGKLSILISSGDSALYSYEIPVGKRGEFVIDSLLIFGQSRIFYVYNDEKGKEKPVVIKFDNDDLSWVFGASGFENSEISAAGLYNREYYESGGEKGNINKADVNVKVLDSVTVTAKPKRQLDILNEQYTSELFDSGGEIRIDNINSPPVDKAMNALNFLLNRIHTIGVQYGTLVNRKNFSIQDFKEKNNKLQAPRTTTSGSMRFWEVGLFINEIPADLVQLQSLRADQIAIVKFFEAGALGAGSAYPGGAVAVYLNKEISVNRKINKTMQHFEYNGYSIGKEFDLSDQSGSVAGSTSAKNDNATLFWSPGTIISNQSTKSIVTFNNRDFTRNVRIVVEGYDSEGKLIHSRKILVIN